MLKMDYFGSKSPSAGGSAPRPPYLRLAKRNLYFIFSAPPLSKKRSRASAKTCLSVSILLYPNLSPNASPNSNPNPKAQKPFRENKMTLLFRASV